MHRIDFTPEAVDDLASLRPFDQRRVVSEVEDQLAHEPSKETRHRKRLRPNRLAEWELRIGVLRVFYDVITSDDVVKIVAIGRKVGSDLYIHGEKYDLS